MGIPAVQDEPDILDEFQGFDRLRLVQIAELVSKIGRVNVYGTPASIDTANADNAFAAAHYLLESGLVDVISSGYEPNTGDEQAGVRLSNDGIEWYSIIEGGYQKAMDVLKQHIQPSRGGWSEPTQHERDQLRVATDILLYVGRESEMRAGDKPIPVPVGDGDSHMMYQDLTEAGLLSHAFDSRDPREGGCSNDVAHCHMTDRGQAVYWQAEQRFKETLQILAYSVDDGLFDRCDPLLHRT